MLGICFAFLTFAQQIVDDAVPGVTAMCRIRGFGKHLAHLPCQASRLSVLEQGMGFSVLTIYQAIEKRPANIFPVQ
jgi:hypothetical protein